jgi:trehalose-6-phosphatase
MKRKDTMIPFFEHWHSLAGRFEHAAEWLLIFDYEGTLMPTTRRPSQAKLSEVVRRKLRRLILREHCAVAVVSERSLADLRHRVGIHHLIYMGNHGLDIESNGWGFASPAGEQTGRPLHWNRGSAVNWLRRVLSRRTLVFYLGDGAMDEVAFQALAKVGVTLRVGMKKGSAAAYYVSRQSDVRLVLDKLIAVGRHTSG